MVLFIEFLIELLLNLFVFNGVSNPEKKQKLLLLRMAEDAI